MEEASNTLAKEKTAIESSLHTFYRSQLEAIVDEKVAELQELVNQWEKKLAHEKAEALQIQREEYELKWEAVKTHYAKLEAQYQASEGVVLAARREADALREQLDLYVKGKEN